MQNLTFFWYIIIFLQQYNKNYNNYVKIFLLYKPTIYVIFNYKNTLYIKRNNIIIMIFVNKLDKCHIIMP